MFFHQFHLPLRKQNEFRDVQLSFTLTVPLNHSAVLRSARRSLERSRLVRMRRKLLPQTAAAAVIRQRRATGENLSVLNHGDVLNDAFRRGERRVSSCILIRRILSDAV